MSDALSYLMKVRPDAMGHYFNFAKEAGRHLDPKTKALISVITKVASQTEKGFRQYLTRALQQGVTPNEILDALLMAFPVLGLAKIVWAVDILLDMDIPEFHLGALIAEEQWHDIAGIEQLAEGASRLVHDQRELFVYRQGASVRVFDSRCPHQLTNIPESALAGFELTCPKHGWRFDVRSGDCIAKGNRGMSEYETKVEAGRLLAWW